MRITCVILSGLILLTACSYRADAARRNRQRPWTNMNVGALSDQIFGAMGGPINRNNRGNPNGRQFRRMPPEPRELNLTVNDIVEQYPWIQNPTTTRDGTTTPQGVGTSGPDLGNGRLGLNTLGNGGRKTGQGNRRDGKTRFNNPRYLRDRLDGLNRDNYGFRVTQGVQIGDGKYKVKLNQDWREVPIYGTSLVLEQESDTNLILESADGDFLSGIEEDISSETPSFTKEQAIAKAQEYNNDQNKPIENPHAELMVDTIGDTAVLSYLVNYFVPGQQPADPVTVSTMPTETEMPSTTGFPRWRNRGRRRRCRRRRNRGRRRCPSIETTPAPTNPPTTVGTSPTEQTPPTFNKLSDGMKRPWVMINAKTGTVYKSWEGLTAVIRPSRVSIALGNPVYGINTYSEIMYKDTGTQNCFLQRPLGGRKFLRVNDKKTANTANVHKFACAEGDDDDYDITNEARSTRNAAFKWGVEAVNFLRRTSGSRWTFDVNIQTHHSGIHAVWNGVEVQLGDGDPRFFYPLTTPDTVTHEVTHGFTEHNSGLEYQQMSGAINEAYSDMAAVAFMNYHFPQIGSKVYRIGRPVMKLNHKLNLDTAIRDICNPRNNDLLLYNPKKPVITSALDYNIHVDLHNASALYSKAFCELSKTTNWNIQQAFKVFTNANAIYWSPRETFNSAACGVKKAAYDFKNTDQSAIDVDNAFAAVDIACDNSEWQSITPAPSL